MNIKRVTTFFKQFLFAYRNLILFAILIVVVSVFIPVNKKESKKTKSKEPTVLECDRSKYATVAIEPKRAFRDLNDIQNEHARANGLKKVYDTNAEFFNDSTRLLNEGELVRISNNPHYHIKELTHSFPYTTPETAALLEQIGSRFYLKLKEKSGGNYRLLVTSVLRTEETQNSLMRRNRNASTQSAHLFGTTVDITYKEFYNANTGEIEPSAIAVEALRETMLDLREECRLLVVRERRQAVFHFTVVNCDPLKASVMK